MSAAAGELDPAELVRRSRGRDLGPWTGDHLARVVLMDTVALAMVVTSWYQAAGTGSVRGQLAWLNLGVLALVLAAASNGLWLLQGRQAIGLARMAVIPGPGAVMPTAPPAHQNGDSGLVSGVAMTRYHLPECPLVAGKTVTSAARGRHERSGLRPCAVCEP